MRPVVAVADCQRLYRLVDFKRRKFNVPATVELEYDPNRTAFIALIKYEDGQQAILPQRLGAGDQVIATQGRADVKPGNAMPMANIPIGTIIHNVEMKAGKGGQIARVQAIMSNSSAVTADMPS